MSKHTPGPWCYQYTNDVGPFNNYFVEFFEITSEAGTKIAEVEEEKDAFLISAAPDLLEALKLALPDLHGYWKEKADAAIAKAMGEN